VFISDHHLIKNSGTAAVAAAILSKRIARKMGRKLQFSRKKALHKAMESFWQRGYEATSMRDLADTLGLHLGSVYNALGTKEKVFEEALRLNFELHIIPRLTSLLEAEDPAQAVRDYLAEVATECRNPETAFGCFIVNSLHEITKINENVTTLLHSCVRAKEEAFAHCIRRCQKTGDVNPDRDAQKLAHFAVATVFSMRAMAKMGANDDSIEAIRECAERAILN
jgi:TetR/AcrR family transcriptional regulator, transcriptional repressor for nem operon